MKFPSEYLLPAYRPLQKRPIPFINLTIVEIVIILAVLGAHAWYAKYRIDTIPPHHPHEHHENFTMSSVGEEKKPHHKFDPAIEKTKTVGKALGVALQWDSVFLLFFVIKTKWISFCYSLFHVSFERAIRYHKMLAIWSVLVATAHGMIYVHYWHLDGGDALKEGLTRRLSQDKLHKTDNLFGLISWGAMCVMAIMASPCIRRFTYELFYRVHILLFPVFFIFGIMHARPHEYLMKFLPLVALFVVDWIVRIGRMFVTKNGLFSIKTLKVSSDHVRMEVQKPGWSSECRCRSGQYAFVCVPKISHFQFHPLTILQNSGNNGVVFYIQPSGNWGKSLFHAAASKGKIGVGDTVIVDGPFGEVSQDIWKRKNYSSLFMVGGGIGGIKFFGILQALIRGGNGHHEESSLLGGGSSSSPYVIFTWSVPSISLVSDILSDPCISDVMEHIDVLFSLRIHVVQEKAQRVDVETVDEEIVNFRAHYPNVDVVVGEMISWKSLAREMNGKCAVMICGPAGMCNSALHHIRWNVKNASVDYDVDKPW